ncbi:MULTISPECIES: hypothetical protein [unclassified Sphingomonas]|uniref:hypothetical protein n=1 Tax=unclassified Sphingomonas TaxID=196159 RepID=UPI000AAFB87C|nr:MULTISPECIES: hypothetical protein [unclassified Sphingomonas]
MFHAIGAVLLAASPTPADAGAIIAAFDRTFCRPGASRLDTSDLTSMGLTLVRNDVAKGVDYAVDGPVSKNDRTFRRWEGDYRGGTAALWNLRFDFEEGTDSLSARLILSPAAEMTGEAIERRIGGSFRSGGSPPGQDGLRVAETSSAAGTTAISIWSRASDETGKIEWYIACRVEDI